MEISISARGLHCTIPKRSPLQLLRVMKLTVIIIVVVCVHVSAHSYSQTISFSGKNVPLQSIFASIEKQTGLSFFFNYALIKDTKPVTLEVRDAPMEKVLTDILREQGLDFYRTGKTIFILKMEPSKNAIDQPVVETFVKQVDIKGKVINKQGEPLAGATVTVKKVIRATLTDEKGFFELKSVPTDAILEISFTGYKKNEIVLDGRNFIEVQLSIADNNLDEAQVIAYGNTTQRLNVGNVTIVKGEDIQKQPVNNPLLALEGRVPGVFITQTSGLPGAPVTVQIQGQNSMTNGNDPLYIIDGIPYTSQLLPNNAVSSLGGSPSPLSFINPADIESISVLKDADATAIYGSRAGNGAILITTKKGKVGAIRVNFDFQQGKGDVTRKLKMMNTSQYLQMRHEALTNDGISTPGPTDYDINGFWDSTRYTDWQKELIGQTAQYTNINGTISGGSATVQYLVGGTYHRETTVFPGDFNDRKGSLHFNLNTSSNNQKFKFQLNGNYLIDANHLPATDFTQRAITLVPDAPALYAPNGTLNWMPNDAGASSWTNPLASNYNTYTIKTTNFVSSAAISYEIFTGVIIKSSFGYTNMQSNDLQKYPIVSLAPEVRSYNVNSAYYSYNNLNSWNIEPQINFRRILGKGKFDFLLGSTIFQNSSNGMQLNGVGYNSDAVLQDIRSASSVYVTGSTASLYRYNALFGRINYNWNDKYILDLTARRDGSSRFGSANRFHNFGSIGAGWIFSQENFIKKNLSFISFGKLRASYGVTGNDQIGDYGFLSLYYPLVVEVPYQGVTGLVSGGIPNPYLHWEETKKLQFGVDLGLINDRITINIGYARNRSSNQLLSYQLPIITGVIGVTENFPALLQNTDWEISLRTINIKRKNFNWTSNFNLTVPNNNKLLAFPGLSTSSYRNVLVIGQPINVIKVFHSLGVDEETGKYQFTNSHGSPTFEPDPITDKMGLVNTLPKFYGGFQNSISYKGFQLDFLLQFVKRIAPTYFYGALPGGFFDGTSNQPVTILDRWQEKGDRALIQRYNSDYSLALQFSNLIQSDAYYKDASYVRLKNLSLSYSLSSKWKDSMHLAECSFFIQAQNLLTFTGYSGLDPENTSTFSLPPLRVITVGLHVGM
jgi:TonB-linked SusC/RagA family outer membrane protein